MKFAGKVYAGDLYLGDINANCMTGLKQKASLLCNQHKKPTDTMLVYHANWMDIDEVKYTRINKLSPDNRIVRGSWR